MQSKTYISIAKYHVLCMHINNKYRPTYQDPLRDIDCYTKLIAWKSCKAVHLLVLITLNDKTENIFFSWFTYVKNSTSGSCNAVTIGKNAFFLFMF